MTTSGSRIADAVGRAVRLVRTEGALATAAVVVAVAPAVLVVAWLMGPERWAARGAGPLVLVGLAAVGAVGAAVALGRRWVARVDDAAVAAAAERRQGLPEGSVRGMLELGRQLSPGGSRALFERSEFELDLQLAPARTSELAGDLGDRARSRRTRALAILGGLLLIAGVAGFVAPERARAAWAPLLSPVEHLRGPVLPPIGVEPGDAEVERGTPLEIAVTAPLRTRVTMHWRATGDVPRESTLRVRGGRTSGVIGPVDADTRYWIVAPDGAVSDTFTVEPVDPLLLSSLSIDLIYPPHVGRDADHFEGQPPPLRLPEGTRVRVQGSATRPLSSAELQREDGRSRSAAVDGSSFSLDWRPEADASGRWEWRLGGDGALPSASPGSLDLTIVPDAPPQVRITVPGVDTLMPPSLRQQLVADASDDYGVATAELLYRRVSASGQQGPEARQPIAVGEGLERILIRAVLDARETPLAPGDAIEYRIAVRDGSPGGQVGSSPVYRLTLPGMSQLREQARSEAEAVQDEAEALAERSRDLETATRDLSRRAAGRNADGRRGSSAGRPSSEEGRLGFEEASEARQVLEEHEQVLSELEAVKARMEELEAAIEAAGLRDPALEQRLAELRQLYAELASPEMREQLERLREGVEELDPQAVQAALEQLAERQEELRRQIEESLDLMKRAAAEQEMNALAREAEEIATQQQALAEAIREEAADSGSAGEREPAAEPTAAGDSAGAAAPRPDSAGQEGPTPPRPQERPSSPQGDRGSSRAEQQEEMEERADDLNRSMQTLQQQLMQIGERDAAQQTSAAQQKGKSAQQSMQQASQQTRRQQGEQAAQSGERAASQMGDAARALDQARQQMTENWREEAQQAVQQATQDALSLAQREEALRQQMEQAQQQGGAQGQSLQQMRSDQAALQQGLQQLGQNLSDAGQRSQPMGREVSQALARAMLNMQQTMQSLQDGQGQMPVQQAEQTVESLNRLAMELLQSDAQMQGQSGSAMQQAMQQLSQLAQEQASLNGQTSALAPMDLSRQAMQAQLQQMAERQRGIARRTGQASDMMGGQENVLGRLDQLSSEAEAIARALEEGRLDPEVRARQERLFHRLLDAGRSLEREEYSDERVGQRPGELEALPPEALDPALLDGTLRYSVPTPEQLRALPPAYRRLIIEYFDRLNRAAPPGDPGGDGEGG